MIIQIEIPNEIGRTIHQLAVDAGCTLEEYTTHILNEWHFENFGQTRKDSVCLLLNVQS